MRVGTQEDGLDVQAQTSDTTDRGTRVGEGDSVKEQGTVKRW